MAILKAEGGQIGLVRMVQATSSCVVEATIDNIPIGEYSINIHQLGDISQGGDRYRKTMWEAIFFLSQIVGKPVSECSVNFMVPL